MQMRMLLDCIKFAVQRSFQDKLTPCLIFPTVKESSVPFVRLCHAVYGWKQRMETE